VAGGAIVSRRIEQGVTRECDGCGVEGVVCDTVDGEVRVEGDRLAMHPALVARPSLEILVAGRSDGSDLHHTYCEDCAEVVPVSLDPHCTRCGEPTSNVGTGLCDACLSPTVES
jgi:hypothetical protein